MHKYSNTRIVDNDPFFYTLIFNKTNYGSAQRDNYNIIIIQSGLYLTVNVDGLMDE